MKYFVKEFPLGDNDQTLTDKQRAELHRRFIKAEKAYHLQLDKLEDRLPKKAWEFFKFGFADSGLHDGNLLSVSIGDGLAYDPNSGKPFSVNRSSAQVRLTILSRRQHLLHTFFYQDLRRVLVDVPSDEPLWLNPRKCLDMVLTYEITSVDRRYLRNEWLLVSGGILLIEFGKLTYSKKRLRTSKR